VLYIELIFQTFLSARHFCHSCLFCYRLATYSQIPPPSADGFI